MLHLAENIRATIQSMLQRCGLPSDTKPTDEDFYTQCADEAIRRGYPMDGHFSVRTRLREGVAYTATCLEHLDHQPTRIWAALLTSCIFFVDDTTSRASDSELGAVYEFSDRFFWKRAQLNGVLDAFADLLRETPVHYLPIPSKLITTSIMNFVTSNLLEYETKDMDVSKDAQKYPGYTRTMSGVGEAYSFLVFSREIPLNDYVQAIPEVDLFIQAMNDVLSFYKEEKAGETVNQISLMASTNGTSKLEAFNALAEATVEQLAKISKILEASPVAYHAFRQFAAGYVAFHISTERYHLADLRL